MGVPVPRGGGQPGTLEMDPDEPDQDREDDKRDEKGHGVDVGPVGIEPEADQLERESGRGRPGAPPQQEQATDKPEPLGAYESVHELIRELPSPAGIKVYSRSGPRHQRS